ncbi:MAG: 2-C-methyl-D-erythritol 4-phosphate cytidylyltransferase, partial [Prevotella sp.]|nr:2-C-methyl-D-erythritol 4-phosphate cytidylyltransferase [Prevotella sp.]
ADSDYVWIHDAARPFVTREILDAAMEAAEEYGAAVPVVPVKDTVYMREGADLERIPARDSLCAAQTPQTFRTELILAAHAWYRRLHGAGATDLAVTDDAMLVHALLNEPVHLVEGSPANLKVTTPELHAEGHHAAEQQENERGEERVGVERLEKRRHRRVVAEVHVVARHAQRRQSEQQKRQSEKEVAHVAAFLHVDEDDADEKARIDEVRDVKRRSERHDPRRERRSDVRTHDDADGLRQREQSGIHKRDGHHRRGG